VNAQTAADASRRNSAERLRTRPPEILFSVLILLLLLRWVLYSYGIWHARTGSDWNSSEWMISYSAGFVRRGLAGTVLLGLLRHTGWSFFAVWIAITSAVLLAVSGWFSRITAALGGPAVWRAALLLNPLFFLSAAESGTFLRKDLLFAAATIVHAALVERLLHKPSRERMAFLVLVLVAVSVLLPLMHEGIFLFAWLPLNVALAAWALFRSVRRRWLAALLLLVAFGPSLAATAASALYHGNAQQAAVIANAWHRVLPGSSVGSAAFPEVDSLTWTPRFALSIGRSALPMLPLLLAVALIGGAVAVLAIRILVPGSHTRRLSLLLVLPLIAALPLFLLGMDWGRWLCILGRSSFPIMIRPALFASGRTDVSPISPVAAGFRRYVERFPVVFIIILLCLPLAPWPCRYPLIAYNPFFLLLDLLSQFRAIL
jgi:hypothetical protein